MAAPARNRELPGREWRQFKRLTRDACRRLLDNLVVAKDADPLQFALWSVALATTLPLLFAVRKIVQYGFLVNAPAEVALRQVLADRLFFLTYGMLAAALLAALAWDALFPDRADQEIVGVLPVRPRTLAASRLAAAAGIAAGFAAAINLPSGLIYALAQTSLVSLGWLPRLLLAHLGSTMLACMFVFLGLLCLRGIVAVCAGERIAARLALALQLVTVVAFVEVFMFLPGILPRLVRELQGGTAGYTWLPPVWFGGLYSWVAEGNTAMALLAGVSVLSAASVAALATLVSLVPAAWMGRRVIESSPRERAGSLMLVARAVAALTIRSAPVRGLFLFSVASLVRSRRHALVLATYVGFAIAIGVVGLISSTYLDRLVLDRPTRYVLALPMVFVFFAVFGLRVAFAIPTDVEANWPLRITPPTVRQAVSVTRRLLWALGVAPIALAWLAITLALWPAQEAWRATALMALSGIALAEMALSNWTKVPFAAAHEPAAMTLRKKWPLYVFALHVFGFMLAEVQLAALQSSGRMWSYVLAAAIATGILRLKRERALRNQTPTFDAVDEDGFQTLDLSEALS
jgi:hypothetical protein